MGFSSWMCSKSKLSIPAFPWADLPGECSKVVVVLPDDTVIRGHYDGYGKVSFKDENGIQAFYDIPDLIREFAGPDHDWEKQPIWKMVAMIREDYYNGET